MSSSWPAESRGYLVAGGGATLTALHAVLAGFVVRRMHLARGFTLATDPSARRGMRLQLRRLLDGQRLERAAHGQHLRDRGGTLRHALVTAPQLRVAVLEADVAHPHAFCGRIREVLVLRISRRGSLARSGSSLVLILCLCLSDRARRADGCEHGSAGQDEFPSLHASSWS